MSVVALVGSPRKGGNCDLLVEEVLRGAQQAGTTTSKFYLADLSISPCRACYSCMEKGECVIDDDMKLIYEACRQSKSWVIASPIYWFTVSAQLKACMDRWFALIGKDYKPRISPKRAIIILVCGDPDTEMMTKPALDSLQNSLEFLGAKIAGVIKASAGEKGEVAKQQQIMNKAFELGKQIAEGGA